MGRDKASRLNAKRQRFDPLYDHRRDDDDYYGTTSTTSDYYDLICNSYENRRSWLHDASNRGSPGFSLDRGQIISSWLSDNQWVEGSYSRQQHREQEHMLPITSVVTDDGITSNEEREHDGLSTSKESPSFSFLLRADIDSLSKQLLQVKRRLLPAAELCAEWSNQSRKNSNGTYLFEPRSNTLSSARDVFNAARSQCNPMEVLGERRNGGLAHRLFLNRAAIKLANLDALLNFELTKSFPTSNGHDTFVFVDLCGAPGGFSEYVLMRRRQQQTRDHSGSWNSSSTYGYGMSLNGYNEYGHGTPWRLSNSSCSSSTIGDHGNSLGDDLTHEHYQIFNGIDGSGDVFLWNNVQALLGFMKEDYSKRCLYSECSNDLCMHDETDNDQAKANLVLADGGFDAQRDSEHQEAMTQKLVVCEVAAALALLRKGGTLVVKMFGFQTSVIRALLADLKIKFGSANMVALKPVSSRPASAERYLVCRGFCGLENCSNWKGGPAWRNQMFLANLPAEATAADPSSTTSDWHEFWSYIDTFDRNLLRLNLKACFSILTRLENLHQQQQAADCHDGQDWYDDFKPSSTRVVDIAAYKHSWKLNNA
ncbi:hypothetical protein ACA910_016754 [Epithemia clementina (nom. ined.)]